MKTLTRIKTHFKGPKLSTQTVRAKHALSLIGLFTTLLLHANAYSQSSEACFQQAKRPLEKALCDVKKASPSSNLPSIEEFKKNTERVQYLLLKRDAERVGIALSKPQPAGRQPASSSSKTTTRPSTRNQQNTAERQPRITKQPSLANCHLGTQHIRCETSRYELLGNKKNNQLRAEAFSSHNQLVLPQKQNTEFSDQSDYRYLSHIYPTYIYKMLELGLADSTMSFTKFATVYWQNKMEGMDFSERFQFMYNKLKTEKSRNAIKARYRSNEPQNLSQCMRLDSKIIVCDNMKQNWIYKLL